MTRKTTTIIGVAVALLLLVGVGLFRAPAIQDTFMKQAATTLLNMSAPSFEGLNVVVCGSASPMGNSMERAQACIAVVTPEHFFLIDTGARSPVRIAQARLPMNRITGVLLTHYHSDHIASLPDVNLQSWIAGRNTSLPVYGPKGVDQVVKGFNQAYALDQGYRAAHHGTELLPPSAGPMTPITIEPGIVWQDDSLTITSFIVEHDPIEPAVGYRVDYQGRSVVVSGDSNAVPSLFAAAKNSDLLFHDALARHSLDIMMDAATAAGQDSMAKIIHDVIDYHADTRTLEQAADDAGIRQLVLYHLVPTPANALAESIFRRGLRDETLLANDLQTFKLPIGSAEILIN